MRRDRPGIVGTVLAALILSGCGEDPGIQQGTVPYKKSDTEPLTSLKNEMARKTQEKAHLKKSEEEDKPAADSKSKAAAQTKPAPETKPEPKGG